MFAIMMATYLGSSLFVARWLYRNHEQPDWDSPLFVIGMIFISPLIGLGWLQEKARKYLDIWFEKV